MIVQTRATGGWPWKGALALSALFAIGFTIAVYWLLAKGVGVWGVNVPVAWGFAIVNFVWWIGIGHAGTFISAILFLCQQEWRTAVNRLAETMTIFAVICAGMFPLLHLGRPWYFYWLLPYHDTMKLWPQFRSPLVWDVFAVFTYLTVSILFWYLGLIPDLAYLRDRADKLWVKRIYAVLALGWRGSGDQWRHYRSAYLILAGVATPLVISVHSVVGMDFAAALVPGWHSTIFPPYFVAGAIFSGFAMVLTLAVIIRKMLKLEHVLTVRHLDLCARFTLAMSLLVTYGYVCETFSSFYSGDPAELSELHSRFFGTYGIVGWLMIVCNVMIPQLFWLRGVRQSPVILFIISLFINVGMWSERFVIVVGSLHHDFMSSRWHVFVPTVWDWLTLFGSMGVFALAYLLFARTAPLIPITELRKEREYAEAEYT